MRGLAAIKAERRIMLLAAHENEKFAAPHSSRSAFMAATASPFSAWMQALVGQPAGSEGSSLRETRACAIAAHNGQAMRVARLGPDACYPGSGAACRERSGAPLAFRGPPPVPTARLRRYP